MLRSGVMISDPLALGLGEIESFILRIVLSEINVTE